MSSQSSSPPLMPEPSALRNDSSLLTRRFGKEVVNYYAGTRLNRYSFLRTDALFLRRAAASPAARYVVLRDLNPLVADRRRLACLTFADVRPLIGPDPFRLTDDEAAEQFDSVVAAQLPLVLFLGTVEGDDTDDAVDLDTAQNGLVHAQPYFAVDATPRGGYAKAADDFWSKQEAKGLMLQTNVRNMTLNAEAASMYAQARSMIDWNVRNPFCAGCGSPTLSVAAGYKRICPLADRAYPDRPAVDCPTRLGVSNVCFPRSDPTMIAAVVSADGQRILLGRQSRYPPHWYSTLAGFLEPGESVEEAVRREVWEEAGVKVGRVVIHSSQPWPYPSTLMLGAIAQALPGHEHVVLNDKELELAKWFSLDDVSAALRRSAPKKNAPAEDVEDDALRLPPPQAIANQLISAVVDGFLTDSPKI
ncbi:hypothetical protein CDD81_6785 [Ophiocordyceps australis]|uniref:NAD(+) diphosphatase n=1 Tax=Ophiocordyceps australis TaxID=1399860 RepID=A0A2C5Y4V8_9HYPO|nr:hypothetical protein CDD81_6785 [Ophiocordyceps australis]